jgi:hypothetical protein
VRSSGQNRESPIVHADINESGLGSATEFIADDGSRRYGLSFRAGHSIQQFGDDLSARLQPLAILLLDTAEPFRSADIALHAGTTDL